MLRCMCMKRTQILVDPRDWEYLSRLAKEQQTSIGGLVRYAIRKTYIEQDIQKKRAQAVDAVLKNRVVQKGTIDYKALIEDGRTY